MNMLSKITIGWFLFLLAMKLVKTLSDFSYEGAWFPNWLQLGVALIFLLLITLAIHGLVKNKLSGFYLSIGINIFLGATGILGLIAQIYILVYPEVYLMEPMFWNLLAQFLIGTVFTFLWLKKGKLAYKKT